MQFDPHHVADAAVDALADVNQELHRCDSKDGQQRETDCLHYGGYAITSYQVERPNRRYCHKRKRPLPGLLSVPAGSIVELAPLCPEGVGSNFSLQGFLFSVFGLECPAVQTVHGAANSNPMCGQVDLSVGADVSKELL